VQLTGCHDGYPILTSSPRVIAHSLLHQSVGAGIKLSQYRPLRLTAAGNIAALICLFLLKTSNFHYVLHSLKKGFLPSVSGTIPVYQTYGFEHSVRNQLYILSNSNHLIFFCGSNVHIFSYFSPERYCLTIFAPKPLRCCPSYREKGILLFSSSVSDAPFSFALCFWFSGCPFIFNHCNSCYFMAP